MVRTFLIKLLVSTIAVMFGVYLLGGVHLIPADNFTSALMLAMVLGMLNSLLRPLLILLTLPATVFSFGLFILVINAAMILLADRLLDSFRVESFWWALAFSLIVSSLSSLIEALLRRDKILVQEQTEQGQAD